MELHGNASARPRRLLLGMTMAAALAVTLAACSGSSSPGSGGTAAHVSASTSAGVTAPASTSPASASAAAASGLSGKWSGRYSGAYHGTFVLTWHQSGPKLSGRIKLSAPAVTLPIHGSVTGGAIRFGTVGSVGITYSGSVSGSSMSGTYQVHAASGSADGPWSAAKSS
jgi:hypothetical protein